MASNSSRLASRSLGKSILSIVLGAITVIVTSLATDQLMHSLDIYPPWGEPMNDTGDNLLALAYRTMYGVLGSYVTAKVAPHSPWKHVWIGATIGFVLSTLGAVAAIQQDLGPAWFPVALALTTFPCAWVAGKIYEYQTGDTKNASQGESL